MPFSNGYSSDRGIAKGIEVVEAVNEADRQRFLCFFLTEILICINSKTMANTWYKKV